MLPTRLSVLSHKIFRSISDIVKGLDKLEFATAKDMIGKSLREDYSLVEKSSGNEVSSQASSDSK